MRKPFIALLAAVMPLYIWAEQHAHVHGMAELMLAVEGEQLSINFESPAMNLVGFEHEATTPEQRQAVEAAKARLQSAEALFVFNGARCSLQQVEVDVASLLGEHEEASDADHEEHHHEHSEITADYQFTCEPGKRLQAITVKLPAQFPRIEHLEAMWVTDNGQGAAELSAQSAEIVLP